MWFTYNLEKLLQYIRVFETEMLLILYAVRSNLAQIIQLNE
jgi:hypothetical protein